MLAHHLHARLAWRLALLLLGIRFARGRRTAASWLRAAGIRRFLGYYCLLGPLDGRHRTSLANRGGQQHGWQTIEAVLCGQRVRVPAGEPFAVWWAGIARLAHHGSPV